MIKAEKLHKERIIELLADCFDANKSVNWIIKQDAKRKERIRHLMDYSFDTSIDFEEIYLSEDHNGVIICSMSDDKLPFLEEAYLTARLVLQVTGVDGIRKTLRREEYINAYHPQNHEFIYVWFIAVDKMHQGKGIASAMIREIIAKSEKDNLPIYLETSEERTLQFYAKHGFEIYHTSPEEIFGFKLYFLRRVPAQFSEEQV